MDLASSTFQSTHPQQLQPSSQQRSPNIPSDYLGSTPTSAQIRENPFNPVTSSQHLPHWMTQAFTQGEPNLVNESHQKHSCHYQNSSHSLQALQKVRYQISTTSFHPNFSTNLDDRYKEHLSNNTPVRLDWNTFVAPSPLFGQHRDSNKLHNWALNRLQYRHDNHKYT